MQTPQLIMSSRRSLQLIFALVALVSLANIGVGPNWCSATTETLSPIITVSLTGPLTTVRARRPGDHGSVNGAEELAARSSGLKQLIEGQQFSNIVSSKADKTESGPEIPLAKPGLVRGLSRQASSIGNFFKQKIQNTFASAQGSCTKQAGELKKRLETNYLTVLIRYSKWYSQYKKLYEANKDFLTSPMELVKLEYAKVDKEIYENEIQKTQLLVSESDNQVVDLKRIESMDYLFKVLHSVIENLEQDLKQLKSQSTLNQPNEIEGNDESLSDDEDEEFHDAQQDLEGEFSDALHTFDELDPHEALLDELEQKKQLERAFDRAKRIVGRAATGLLANEIGLIAQIALLDSLATYVMTQPDNPLMFLVPIIRFIGNVNTPLLTSYMRNIQIRTTFKIISLCNPVPTTLGKVLKVKEN